MAHLYEQRSKPWRGLLVTALLFVLLVVAFSGIIGNMGEQTYQREATQLENAIRHATVTCFAVEGFYPPSLDYLVENYGIVVNEERFSVLYSGFASNLMPQINVWVKGGR